MEIHPLAGAAVLGLSFVFYTLHLVILRHYYERSYPPFITGGRKSLAQIGSEYNALLAWGRDEGTIPAWVPRLGEYSVMGFWVGGIGIILGFIF